jgi:hypothetical protein
MRDVKHDGIRPPSLDECPQLVLKINWLLSGEAWHGKISLITLPRESVTRFAILDLGLKTWLGKLPGWTILRAADGRENDN